MKGNDVADLKYGSQKVSPHADKEEKQKYVTKKYSQMAYASAHVVPHRQPNDAAAPASGYSNPQLARAEASEPTTTVIRRKPDVGANAVASPEVKKETSQKVMRAAEIPDSFFEDMFGEASNSESEVKPQPQVASTQNIQKNAADELEAFLNEMNATLGGC